VLYLCSFALNIPPVSLPDRQGSGGIEIEYQGLIFSISGMWNPTVGYFCIILMDWSTVGVILQIHLT
jgi:hypothetical protein